MCGIVGYIGDKAEGKRIVLDGLHRLEYRGYDSAGIAYVEDGDIKVVRAKGAYGLDWLTVEKVQTRNFDQINLKS